MCPKYRGDFAPSEEYIRGAMHTRQKIAEAIRATLLRTAQATPPHGEMALRESLLVPFQKLEHRGGEEQRVRGKDGASLGVGEADPFAGRVVDPPQGLGRRTGQPRGPRRQGGFCGDRGSGWLDRISAHGGTSRSGLRLKSLSAPLPCRDSIFRLRPAPATGPRSRPPNGPGRSSGVPEFAFRNQWRKDLDPR